MSVADGEEMARPLLRRGFAFTDNVKGADAVILNTCTVRQHAEDRALSLIGRLKPWKDERPERFLIVAGCAAERLGDQLRRRFPHIDLVVGAKSIEQYPEILDQALRERFDWASENSGVWKTGDRNTSTEASSKTPIGQGRGEVFRSPASAYVTIMRGCNYSCTYCVVPSVRGRELYRPMETILSEMREKAAAGAKEVILLGQTVNSYRSEGADFSDLLRAANGVDGLLRIRFMSPHPYFLNDRMIQAMAECPKVCRHLHLPLQSGSDRILREMRRNYTVQEFLDKADRLRRAVPGIAFTTDVIAGFPGETENDFEASLKVLESLDPCSAYCFKFSPRPGTQAASFDGQIPESEREERQLRLLQAVEARMQEHLNRWIGKQVEILFEDECGGHIEHYFSARINGRETPGELLPCTVVAASRTGLEANVLPSGGLRACRSPLARSLPP